MPLLELTIALRDRYRVERELGRGGMATVLLAEDLKHHRRVALKVLQPELSAALGSERFLREIEIVAALQHPHILPLYDSGQGTAGHPERGEGAVTRRDEALRALERAYEERSTVLVYLHIDPRLAPLREEPRFVALERRLSGE
jgi:serine/threonine protein kinase